MTTPGYSRATADGAGNREPCSILSVDAAGRTATGLLRTRYTININTAYAVGDSIITPIVGEQWYVERMDGTWRLSSRIPFNDATLHIEPEPGQVSLGSANGPLELNGTEIRANNVFRIGMTYFRANPATGKLDYSLDKTTWLPVSSGTGGGGGSGPASTDDLPEGATNKYYTSARVASDSPVKSVAGRTGNVVLTKSDVGLSLSDNTPDSQKPISNAAAQALALKADLVGGLVPPSQLPLPTVRQYSTAAAFPAPGDPGVLYIAADTALLYRWDGAAFTIAGSSGGGGGGISNTDSLPEGVNNKYYTDARAAAAAPVQTNDTRLSNTRTPTDNTVTTAKIVDGNVTAAKLASDVSALINSPKPYDISFPQTIGVRAVGLGQALLGVKLQRAVTFTSITYRCYSSDASGDLVVELRKNNSQVAGTVATISSANQVAGGTATGTWQFAEGDVLTVYVTAVGTTPGQGLVADIKGIA